MPRLFIAIDLPDDVKAELGRLRVELPGVRWVPPSQLHLTLAFLGDVPGERLAGLTGRLAAIKASSFRLRLGGLGCFPHRRNPRVLWVGVEPEPLLVSLAQRVRDGLAECGIALEERPFAPHITLARIRQSAAGGCAPFLDRPGGMPAVTLAVGEFILYESRLSSGGAQHLPLARLRLVGGRGEGEGDNQMDTSR